MTEKFYCWQCRKVFIQEEALPPEPEANSAGGWMKCPSCKALNHCETASARYMDVFYVPEVSDGKTPDD